MRDDIKLIDSDAISQSQKKKIEQRVIARLDLYTNSIKKEKPCLYYFSSRLKVLKTFFFHSGTYNLFHKPSFELNKLELLIKIFYSLLYILVATIGFFTLFYLAFKGLRNVHFLLISSCGLYSSLVFPLVLKMDEFRYSVPVYPIFVIATTYTLITIYHKYKKTM